MAQLFFDFYNNSQLNQYHYDDFIIHQDNILAHNALLEFLNNHNCHPPHNNHNHGTHNIFFRNIILRGTSGSGKTHLLKFLAHKLTNNMALNFINKDDLFNPELNQDLNLEALNIFKKNEFFVIDDLDAITNEASLLHLINYANEAQALLILVWRDDKIFKLNDLNSRLKNIQSVKIFNTNNDNLKLIFANILSRQQIILSTEIIDYIFSKIPPQYSQMVYALKKIEFYCGENGGKKGSKISLKNITEIFN